MNERKKERKKERKNDVFQLQTFGGFIILKKGSPDIVFRVGKTFALEGFRQERYTAFQLGDHNSVVGQSY